MNRSGFNFRHLSRLVDSEVIVTDTVGFIRDLPPDLVTTFRATLEELADASVLLHLVAAAAAASDCERRIEAVRRVQQDIGMGAPELLVFNHIDRMGDGESNAMARRHGGVAVLNRARPR